MRICVLVGLMYSVFAIAVPSGRDINHPKVLKLPFKKTYNNTSPIFNISGLSKRDLFHEFEIVNEQTFYSVDLKIGTPPQKVTVLLDTGSSDLWVTGADNTYCMDANKGSGTINCTEFGTFNKSLSSTYHDNDTSFGITYVDQTFANGNWGQDILYLDEVDVSGVSFAVANDSDSKVGVLGIGFENLETTAEVSPTNSHPHTYGNLPEVLKFDGAIDTVAYSLYLDDASASSGSILFGGVDKEKYYGNLYTLPIVNIYSRFTKYPIEFDITLQGFGISSSMEEKTITTSQIAVLLDSGTTLTYFPVEYTAMIADAIGAFDIGSGFYVLDCPSPDDEREFVFDFGGFHIKAPLKSFLIELKEEQGTCLLGIIGKDRNPAILGDLFLTHAYVVYDLDNYEISLAQASYTVEGEDIEAIISGVPGAVKAPGYSNTWAGNRAYTTGGNIFTLSDTLSTPTTIAV